MCLCPPIAWLCVCCTSMGDGCVCAQLRVLHGVCVLHKLGGEVCVSVAWLNVLHNKCVSCTSGEEGSVFVCVSIPWLCAAWRMSRTSVEDAGGIFIEWLCVPRCVCMSHTSVEKGCVFVCVHCAAVCRMARVLHKRGQQMHVAHLALFFSDDHEQLPRAGVQGSPACASHTGDITVTHSRPSVVQRRVGASGASVAPILGTQGHPLPSVWIQPNIRSCNWEQKCWPRAGAGAIPWEEMPLNRGSRGRIAPSADLFEKHPIWV